MGTWWESDLFDEKQRLILQLADGMTATPPDVSDLVFDGLRRHFSIPDIVELTAEIAFENFRARFNRTFEIEAPRH